MTRDSKNISNSLRPKIDTIKCMIRYAVRPFDGTGYIFNQAVKELRLEGLNIVYQKEKCNYILVNDTQN